MDSALETKLRELLDRDAIMQVIVRYGRGMDRQDRDLIRSCYHPDAIDDHDQFVGDVDGIIEYGITSTSFFLAQHHAVMNHSCELDGDDAYCETYFQFTGFAPEPPHFMAMGRYIDHFQRRDGEWRIANRVMVNEGGFDLLPTSMSDGGVRAYPIEEGQPCTRDGGDVSYHRPPRPRAPRPMR